MKKYLFSVLFTLTILSITACHKSDVPVPVQPHYSALAFPYDVGIEGGFGGQSLHIPTLNVWGIFSAERLWGSITFVDGKEQMWDQYAGAVFPLDSLGFVPRVSINKQYMSPGYQYDANTTDPYRYIFRYDNRFSSGTADSTDLSIDNEWTLGDTSHALIYTYNYKGAFPSIVDNFPDTITKSTGATFTFNSANVIGADSIILVLQCDTTSIYKTGSATGSIHFSPGELQAIASNTADTLKHTCFMNLTYYRYTIQTFGGRRYAFAKCGHYIKDITIKE